MRARERRAAERRWSRLNDRSKRRSGAAAIAATSLIVGLMSAFAPTAAMAVDWSGPRADAAAAVTAGADAALARTSGQLISPRMAPGNPGVPSDPEVIFEEDFENRDADSNVSLVDYVGAEGTRYTADPYWISRDACNGFIINQLSPRTDSDCGSDATYNSLTPLPYALGTLGEADAASNAAAASFTAGSTTDNEVQFRTTEPLAFAGTDRFVTFSVDAAATSCFSTHPQLRFYLIDGNGQEVPVSSSAIDPCTDPRAQTIQAPRADGTNAEVSVGSFAANDSVLLEGDSFGIVMRNENGSGAGNDGGYDNIRVLDVTPQLDKSFSPETAYVGGVSTLTFTVTNTSELAQKTGWSFTDTLPDGLTVASSPNLGGTCVADRTATAGDDSIAVSNGSLAAGAESCTITVDVTSDEVGTYVNGPDNVTETGLNPPADTPVEFIMPPAFACSTDGYLFQSIEDGSGMFAIDLATGGSELLGTYAPAVNAVGYNPLDGYFYGWSVELADFVRIDADLNVTPIGVGDPRGGSTVSINTGDINEEGQLFVTGQFTNVPWFQIDLAPGSDTYGEVVAQGTRNLPTGTSNNGADWSWIDGYLYSVSFLSVTGTTPQLMRFDPETSQTVNLGALDVVVPPVTGTHLFGATYADADGNLYASHNGSGTILRINVETLDVVEFAQGPSSSGNDGARCAAAAVPIDLGDAPASYGTTIADDGARHALPGYDADTNTAPVMLGGSVDPENDGQPTAAATGDDENGVADEDGVVFNPDLGYGTPTLRTGVNSVSLQPIENTLEVTASADGFVSAWVDWNQDGVFSDDERVANAQPVTAGANDVTFEQGTNPTGIFAQVRVRYSTDAASIALPTGPAPDGEVEDYRALVERVIQSNVCAVSDTEFSAFTFNEVGEHTGDGTVGSTARYPNVSVIDGTPVDMFVEVVGGRMSTTSTSPTGFHVGSGGIFGTDDAQWQINRDATIRYSFYEAGTTTPIEINSVFTVSDLDGGINNESGTFSAADLAGYAVSEGSAVQITEDGDDVVFSGNGNWNGDPESRFQVVFEGLATFEVHWLGAPNSGFGFDGDGDLAIDPACADFGDAPDSYGTLIESDGAQHGIVAGLTLGELIDFDPDGQPSDDALGDDENRIADEDGVATPIVVNVGDETTVTVSATNDTADVATIAGWIDLDGNGTFDAGELVTVSIPATSGTADYVLTFPAGTVTADTFARFRLFPGAVTDPLPTGAATAGEVEDYAVTVQDRELELEKTSDMTADSRVGDEITYTVTATNTGSGDFTDEFPAVVFDDLSGVLDDATYNDDATAAASDGSDVNDPSFIPASFLSWSGPLAAGESVEITYTVTLAAGGDGTVRNVAWQPTTPPPPGTPPTDVPLCDPQTDEGTDPVTGEVCVPSVGELPKLTVAKTSDTVDLPADGGVVTYTVTVTNDGPGDFTEDAPASMTDDLSEVLDDATFGEITAPAAGASFDEDAQEVSWSGALEAGDSVEITYTVVYDATTGDNVLFNSACVPADDATDPAANCDFVQIPAAALTMDKTVDPADGTAVVAGQEVTYTLSFTNTGQAPAAVDALDTLADVLDDATLTAGPTAEDGLTADLDGDELRITGEVPVDATLTVSYTVTVNPFADQGDHELGNVLSNGDGTCPPAGCEETENPVRHFTVSKGLADTTPETVNAGDVVTYAVTVVNDGSSDYTTDVPAAISDDLTAVLDDATYNGDATAVVDGDDSIELPTPTVDGSTLDWSGPIAVGQTVTITYTVTVNDPLSGDGELTNTVVPTVPGGECAPGECVTTTPIQSYTVTKAASATSVTPGETITYTVTVTNTGEVDYTEDVPASFEDDLSAVLDDATYNDDATNGATVDGNTLSWSGALVAGEVITVTYSVTVDEPNAGDNVLTNAVVPTGPGGFCDPAESCETVTPVQSYSVTKSASSSTANPGDVVTYEVTVTNTGEVDYTEDAPASIEDDLSAVLDDATYNEDATGGATVTDGTLAWSGALPVGESITITYSVTVNDPNTGDGELTNTVVPTGPGGNCLPEEECITTTDVQSYTVAKTSSAESVQLGGTIEYTVTVTNTGNVDYTEDAPASFTDDLSAVLDDATYNDDATEGAAVAGSTLTWSGALAAGESVDITYSVTVNSPNTGDNVLTNAVLPDGPGGDCVPGECETVTPVQSFTVTKTADANDVVPGDVITYTLTIENTGEAAYTEDSPAALTDDMTAVLDDATYNEDATNGASYEEPTLSWSGPLAVDEVVTITYSVTVNDPVTGDSQIDNAVVTENGGNCAPGSTDPDCITNIPSGSYTVAKTASATTAMPGDVITYTVTVTNTGAIDFTDEEPASFDDNLANVLDDATYNDDASNGATVDGTTLSWEGPLDVGDSIDITYSVTVNPAGSGAGDLNLGNIVVPTSPGGDCQPEDDCITNTPVGEFQVSKTSSGEGEVNEGDVLTYTITVTNDSAVDFTEDAPASFTDDLSAVLDDATYNDDATNGAAIDGETLSWEGPLAAGASIEITYSVTVGAAGSGDGVLTNGVVPGNGGTCLVDCTITDELQAYTVTKTSSAGGTAHVGDIVTYTVTIANTGVVDYTEDAPASFTDDLSAVLDDATYNDDATNGAIVTGGALTWSGPLTAGESVDVTYSVTVLPTGSGDGVLTNAVVPTGPGGSCDPDDACVTTDELQSFTVEKTSSATVVNLSDTLTYAITVTNTGVAAFTEESPAVVTDDLSAVLDDATYNNDATNGAVFSDPMLSWELAIPAGESVTLTYSVTVNDPATGDLELVNAVSPGDGGECIDGSCITETPIASYAVAKSVDTTRTGLGERVTYTITVTNTGAVDYTDENPASFTDDLSEVLDDATYGGDATSGATYREPVLSWAGSLEVGATVTVTYSVTVNEPATGDGQMLNAVVPGDGGSCGDACSTTTDVEGPGLPATGLEPWVIGIGFGGALVALLGGLVLVAIRRRESLVDAE